MNHLRKTLAVGAMTVGVILLTEASAFAATSATSNTTGSYATCSISADGNGSSANYVYTFAARGDFSFKSVTDRGILPDHVGPIKTIYL